MRDYLANEVRNIVLLGHSQAGKTSLVESMLYFTKSIGRFGKISEGNTTSDYDPEEIKRNMSVYTALLPVEWKDCKINFIDTPGYLDFEGEMVSGFSVADNALIVVDAKEGVQPTTEKAYKMVKDAKMPAIFFINKMDDENANFEKAYGALHEKFGTSVIPFEVPIVENGKYLGSVNILRNKAWYLDDRENAKEVPANMKDEVELYYQQIAEAVASTDEELMEKFFNGETFDEKELAKGLRIGVRNGDITPVYCGSSTQMAGIERIMDLVTEYFPSYGEKGIVEALDENEEPVILETNEKEALSATVFKTIIDPFVGKISFLKVLSGVLSSDSQVINARVGEVEKINQIYIAKGKYQEAVGKLFTGDIGILTKLQYTTTGDTLATKAKLVHYAPVAYPRPMLGVAIWPKSKNDEDKMSFGLQRILEEDLTLKLVKNGETKETVLYGLGDQHIDVALNKLKAKYKVEVTTTVPKVQYRETIRKTVEAEGRHKKQTGGAGQFGDVWVRFEPVDSEEMVFAEEVFGGAVPKNFFPAVEAGLRECMNKGVLAGYKVVGVKATLYDGSYHPVDSKEIAFKAAARLAYKAAMPKANPVLLEPIGKAEVFVPEEYTGTVIGDFNKRRGIIMGMDVVDGVQHISAEVPMAEMQKYATELRSMTQGRGNFVVEFDRYEQAPTPVAEKVIKETVKEEDEED